MGVFSGDYNNFNIHTPLAHIHTPLPIWVKFEAVDWSKVTFDPPNLLLEHQVVEPSVKLPCLCVRGGDLHRLLTSSQDNLTWDKSDRATRAYVTVPGRN